MSDAAVLPEWARWNGGADASAYTLGIEEEVMLLEPGTWRLAPAIDEVLEALTPELRAQVTRETHNSALELATGVHDGVAEGIAELRSLREALAHDLQPLNIQAASAGTHPSAVWTDTAVSSGKRYQDVYGSVRELARREPTFALHFHIGVSDPEAAIKLANRLRGHLPLLLALSANSPFWQGRDTGLASARTPLFQAFPRVGIPRVFEDYADYATTVDLLIRSGAIAEATFLWWDVRPQPRFGTVEVRILDAQTRVAETAALAALVQSVARLEIEEGWIESELISAPEVLIENRFIAARDGMDGELISPREGQRVPAADIATKLVAACRPHAQDLGCSDELERIQELIAAPGYKRQLAIAREPERMPGLVAALAADFCA